MAGNVKNKYADLDQLSTARLMEILKIDAEAAGLNDPDMILYILEVIRTREEDQPSGLFPEMNVDQAWHEFQAYYNITEGDGDSLYPETPAEEKPCAEPEGKRRPRRAGPGGRYLRRVGLVAAVMAVLFAGMVTAQAMGVDIFGALARWTDETFHFEAAAPEVNTELTDALRACDMDTALMPTWSPEGFVAGEPKCTELRSKTYIDVTFTRADGQFYSVQIARYASPEGVSIGSYEKDDGPVEQYASNGRLVYIFSNLEHNTAVWSDGVFEVSIVGDLSQEELKQIFDSIGGTS